MTQINSFHKSLLNRKKVHTKEEILNLFRRYQKIKKINHKNIVRYLSKNNYIKRIFLGYYYINSIEERAKNTCIYSDKELLYWVLNKEKIKWYLGLNTAMYEQGKTWQTPTKINIINNKLSGNRKILGLRVRFFKIKENLIFGVKEKETKNNIKYFYSDPAKTYIDRVYFKQVKNITRIKNTKRYLKEYPKWVGKK